VEKIDSLFISDVHLSGNEDASYTKLLTFIEYIKDQKGREEDAEDLLQEALIVLWKNARKPEFTLDAKPSTYVYAVIKNLWLKQEHRQNL
jgi:DNA-directed RNA polymerase specialized sigma24 family protein